MWGEYLDGWSIVSALVSSYFCCLRLQKFCPAGQVNQLRGAPSMWSLRKKDPTFEDLLRLSQERKKLQRKVAKPEPESTATRPSFHGRGRDLGAVWLNVVSSLVLFRGRWLVQRECHRRRLEVGRASDHYGREQTVQVAPFCRSSLGSFMTADS